jgi:uncharacterized glyoxalase superfamily protein PhnB
MAFSLTGTAPSLTVNDLPKSLDFYRLLGFEVAERFEQDGKLLGAELASGACRLFMSQDDFAKGRDRVKGVGCRIYFMTGDDIDELAARLAAAGTRVTQPPTDQSWGMRDVAFVDPDGFQITVAREQ